MSFTRVAFAIDKPKHDGASAGTRMPYIVAVNVSEMDGQYINKSVHGMMPRSWIEYRETNWLYHHQTVRANAT